MRVNIEEVLLIITILVDPAHAANKLLRPDEQEYIVDPQA